MPKVITAVYEQGVFKPSETVNLPDGAKVQLVVWDEEAPLETVVLHSSRQKHIIVMEQVRVREDLSVEEQVRERQRVYEGLSDEEIAEVERIAFSSRRGLTSQEG